MTPLSRVIFYSGFHSYWPLNVAQTHALNWMFVNIQLGDGMRTTSDAASRTCTFWEPFCGCFGSQHKGRRAGNETLNRIQVFDSEFLSQPKKVLPKLCDDPSSLKFL